MHVTRAMRSRRWSRLICSFNRYRKVSFTSFLLTRLVLSSDPQLTSLRRSVLRRYLRGPSLSVRASSTSNLQHFSASSNIEKLRASLPSNNDHLTTKKSNTGKMKLLYFWKLFATVSSNGRCF